MEIYEIRWASDPDHPTGEWHLREYVRAETATDAVRACTFDAGQGGVLEVYQTDTDDAGERKTGRWIRRYTPDDYGYMWVIALHVTSVVMRDGPNVTLKGTSGNTVPSDPGQRDTDRIEGSRQAFIHELERKMRMVRQSRGNMTRNVTPG